MNRKRVKHVYANKGVWYIRYKDPLTHKWRAVSTKLPSTTRNYPKAMAFRDQLFDEIRKVSTEEYRHGDVGFAFEHFLRVNSNRSDSTKSTYKMFFDYLCRKLAPETPCMAISKTTAEDFLLWLNQLRDINQNTKYGIQKNFLKFLRFLFEYDYIPRVFLINKDVKIRPKVNEPLIFTDADRKTILEGLEVFKKNDNFRLLVNVLMFTGLRPSDIFNLTVGSVDLGKMMLKFYSSKIDKWFIRPIHPALKPVLEARIQTVKSGRLFEYSDIKNMGRAFNRYLKTLGISQKGYNLRTFRKDFISRCQEAGVSINATAILVGHANIRTTMTYYTHLSNKFLRDELSKLQ